MNRKAITRSWRRFSSCEPASVIAITAGTASSRSQRSRGLPARLATPSGEITTWRSPSAPATPASRITASTTAAIQPAGSSISPAPIGVFWNRTAAHSGSDSR